MIIKTKDGWKRIGGEINHKALEAKPYQPETIKCQTTVAAELLKKWNKYE